MRKETTAVIKAKGGVAKADGNNEGVVDFVHRGEAEAGEGALRMQLHQRCLRDLIACRVIGMRS